ncbi:nucleotidyltransferase domain-containing protein [bacterium]|nr:nucleotidyltransferase domain-containing protein [bacterium]
MKDEETYLNHDIDKILDDIVEKLKRDYHPERIILYGSYAWGNPTRHSDIDLFIVKETALRWVDRFVKVKEIIFDPQRGIPVSPNVYTPSEIKERLGRGDAFLNEIVTKGRMLYERDGRKRKRTQRVV